MPTLVSCWLLCSVAWRDGCVSVHAEGVKQAEGVLGQGWLLRSSMSEQQLPPTTAGGCAASTVEEPQPEKQMGVPSSATDGEALSRLRSQYYDNVTEDEQAQEKFRLVEKACFSGDVRAAVSLAER